MTRWLETHGWPMEDIRDEALAAHWLRPSRSGRASGSLLRSLFSRKMYKDGHWRGPARMCRRLVFMLQFYVTGVERRTGATPETRSFAAMHACCRLLRSLEYAWRPMGPEDARALEAVQSRHQELFCGAWGAALSKPKHHHRFHLSAAMEQLRFLPTCEIHEKKHGWLKSGGLVDRLETPLNDGLGFQKAILPRFLEATLTHAAEGFAPWGALEPLKAASKDLKARLRDASAQTAAKAQFWGVQVGPGDLVWLPGGEPAGQIRACVTGKSGCVLLCRRMRRLAWEPYGSRWLLLADEFLLQPGKGGALELPSWWRFDEANAVTCLH